MKLFKLANIVSFYLIGQNFVFSLLIDDFLDRERKDHILTTGTDFNIKTDLNIKRELSNQWTFPTMRPSTVECPKGGFTSNIKYILQNKKLFNFNDITTLQLNASICPTAMGGVRVILFDNKSQTRTIGDIDISTMTPGNPFQIDLNKNFKDDKKFSQDKINKIQIYFNTDNVPEYQIGLDSIELIPEPFSIITLAGGTLAFIKKKCKKNSLV